MQWTIGIIAIALIIVISTMWGVLQRILFQPLSRVIHHIRAISGGDLTQSIEAESKNEIGQLASSLTWARSPPRQMNRAEALSRLARL
ncbi:MAG: HAMP domain-containing protein [Symbiopectobacterium sp.]|uniref:HAMP domain-containing protein n=1 Tax=Symbiopectobacterium sp. TaxID=2952789 RepID=UPI0039EBE4CE